MPSLLDLQRMVRRSIIDRDDSSIVAHVTARQLSAERRLAIYRNTFDSSLTKALRLSFPAVDRLVGAEFFDGAAMAFIRDYPPRSAALNDYGSDFPEFLSEFPPAASLSYLADVARVEWAINKALHAIDVAPIALQKLAELDEIAQNLVRFVAHPSLHLLALNWPADLIWRAVLDENDEELEKLDLVQDEVLLIVSRSEGGVDVTRVPTEIFDFVKDLCSGRSLGMLVAAHPSIDIPAVLADLFLKQRLSAFELPAMEIL